MSALAAAPSQGDGHDVRPVREVKKPAALDSDGSSSDEDFVAPVAELGPDGLPSVGSSGHAGGDCKRCCFFPKGRCQNGHECIFCHFNHEKRKRVKKKKKRGAGSENPTPSSAAGSLAGSLAASLMTPGGSLVGALGMQMTPFSTPMGAHVMPPLTPMTPSAPPMEPPLLPGLAHAEPPPPPAEAPTVQADTVAIGETTGESTTSPAMELPPMIGTATGVVGKPMTLTDLLEGTVPATDADATTATASANPGARGLLKSRPLAQALDLETLSEELPLWPPTAVETLQPSPTAAAVLGGWPAQYWNPYATAQPGWPYYGDHNQIMPYSTLPLLSPQHRPIISGLPLTAPPTPVAGLERDSPRSVVLSLCGAWGALSGPKATHTQADVAAGEPKPDIIPLSRNDLLGFRKTSGSEHCPDVMKSLRVFAMQ